MEAVRRVGGLLDRRCGAVGQRHRRLIGERRRTDLAVTRVGGTPLRTSLCFGVARVVIARSRGLCHVRVLLPSVTTDRTRANETGC